MSLSFFNIFLSNFVLAFPLSTSSLSHCAIQSSYGFPGNPLQANANCIPISKPAPIPTSTAVFVAIFLANPAIIINIIYYYIIY